MKRPLYEERGDGSHRSGCSDCAPPICTLGKIKTTMKNQGKL